MCCRECRPDLIAGRFRPGGSDILQNTGLEQTVILEDKSHLIHQHVWVSLPDIDTAHKNAAGSDIPEPGNEARCRCFAAAGRPDQSYRLSGFHLEGYMVNGRDRCSGVSEAYIPEFHTVVFRNLGMVCDLKDRRTHDLADPSQSCAGQHHTAGSKHDFGQRCGDDGRKHRIESKVGNESGKAAGGKGCRCQK